MLGLTKSITAHWFHWSICIGSNDGFGVHDTASYMVLTAQWKFEFWDNFVVGADVKVQGHAEPDNGHGGKARRIKRVA